MVATPLGIVVTYTGGLRAGTTVTAWYPSEAKSVTGTSPSDEPDQAGHTESLRINASRYDGLILAGEWRREMQRYEHSISSHMLEPHVKGPWMLYEDAADHIAELEAENKKLSAFITMEHTDPPYDYGDSQDVQFAIRIAELEAQLAAAQERERWIPASEAPPKNGPYLILFKGKVIYATFLTNGWYQGYYANSVVPDAWRELPAPPEEAADADVLISTNNSTEEK